MKHIKIFENFNKTKYEIINVIKEESIESLESYLSKKEKEGRLEREVQSIANYTAPNSKPLESKIIFDYIMDNYSELVDIDKVNKWVKNSNR